MTVDLMLHLDAQWQLKFTIFNTKNRNISRILVKEKAYFVHFTHSYKRVL